MSAAAPAAQPAHGHRHKDELHLPHGSWWPFWLALAIFLLGVGLIVLGQGLKPTLRPDVEGGEPVFHFSEVGVLTYVPLLLGVLATVGTLVGWFVQDYHWWNQKVGTGTTIPRAGTLLFISSEIFLFGALFANYFTFQSINAGSWPDANAAGHQAELPLLKTFIFSLFLFASSGTVHMAEAALKRGNHARFVQFWGLTILLGAIFLGGQVLEYMNLIAEGHTLGSSQFMTAFYILTGTHGLHVFGGLCILLVMWVRSIKGQFSAERHAGPQVAAMYWHFVDIVWVFVFGILYLLNVHDWGAVWHL